MSPKVWQLGRLRDKYHGLRRALSGQPVSTAAPPPPPPSAVAANRYDVVCFPIIPWDFRFQRPQQILCQFAAAGHRVFYVDSSFRTGVDAVTFRTIRERIVEASFRGPALNIYAEVMNPAALESYFEDLDIMRRTCGLGATVSIVDLPFWLPLAAKARETFGWPIVYDCMDHHEGFTETGADIVDWETALVNAADVVIVSSDVLEQNVRQSHDRVLLVRNGCDFEHFAGRRAVDATRPIVGYYGAIAEWFDTDLVADLAERRADLDFVLIGHSYAADVTRLSALPNVRLVGEVPYAALPGWLSRFDVTILPFKRVPLTEAANPVKVYETLAAGKPVVSVPLPELKVFSGLVRVASTAAEFDQAITSELKSPGAQVVRERRAFAAGETWSHRFALIEPAVRRTFPKISVVVVTYDNLELTKLCLSSLQSDPDWPRYEIVVVDNGSTDGTADYLRALEKSSPDLRAVLNHDNRGFAAANNQALQLATGDYIVLLNNDTIVPAGALGALIRHLHRDRTLGLVGPVTNRIGNEARVHVDYRDIDHLSAWAGAWMQRHDGQLFEIPMLAMFCLAMRRETFERVGPLDERFGVGLFEDDDYARRVRQAGYRLACARDSYVHHFQRAAFNRMPADEYQRLFDRNRRAYEEKWGIAWTPHSFDPSTSFTD